MATPNTREVLDNVLSDLRARYSRLDSVGLERAAVTQTRSIRPPPPAVPQPQPQYSLAPPAEFTRDESSRKRLVDDVMREFGYTVAPPVVVVRQQQSAGHQSQLAALSTTAGAPSPIAKATQSGSPQDRNSPMGGLQEFDTDGETGHGAQPSSAQRAHDNTVSVMLGGASGKAMAADEMQGLGKSSDEGLTASTPDNSNGSKSHRTVVIPMDELLRRRDALLTTDERGRLLRAAEYSYSQIKGPRTMESRMASKNPKACRSMKTVDGVMRMIARHYEDVTAATSTRRGQRKKSTSVTRQQRYDPHDEVLFTAALESDRAAKKLIKRAATRPDVGRSTQRSRSAGGAERLQRAKEYVQRVPNPRFTLYK